MQIPKYEHVKKNDGEQLKRGWRDKGKFADTKFESRDGIMKILLDL